MPSQKKRPPSPTTFQLQNIYELLIRQKIRGPHTEENTPTSEASYLSTMTPKKKGSTHRIGYTNERSELLIYDKKLGIHAYRTEYANERSQLLIYDDVKKLGIHTQN